MKRLILFTALLLALGQPGMALPWFSSGPGVVRAEGQADLRIEDNMTKAEARKLAKEMAMVAAIESEFGTYVGRQTNVEVGGDGMYFRLIGDTKVKGEWLETTKLRYKERTREVNGEFGPELEIWITCTIKGKIREITEPAYEWEALTLNHPLKSSRTTEFHDMEQLYLHFKSSATGHLSVYAVNEDSAYRLLPYQHMPSQYANAVPVQADEEYIFFSPAEEHHYFEDFPSALTDELVMATGREQRQHWRLYVLFSEGEPNKPMLEESYHLADDYQVPASLSDLAFQNWLGQHRVYDPDFSYRVLDISVSQQ